jgi:hypothetical protein
MSLEIRKFVDYSELVHIEGFKKAEKPLHIFAVAACYYKSMVRKVHRRSKT